MRASWSRRPRLASHQPSVCRHAFAAFPLLAHGCNDQPSLGWPAYAHACASRPRFASGLPPPCSHCGRSWRRVARRQRVLARRQRIEISKLVTGNAMTMMCTDEDQDGGDRQAVKVRSVLRAAVLLPLVHPSSYTLSSGLNSPSPPREAVRSVALPASRLPRAPTRAQRDGGGASWAYERALGDH